MRRGLGIASLLFAATALATPALADKKDNSVIFATEETLNSADPYFSGIPLAFTVADSIWDTLIFRDPRTNEYRGNLATAWHWIDDRTLELDLRRSVKFHNGALFDADDVVYTFNFVAKPENKAIIIPQINWIDHVEKVGQYKIRIVAKQPFPAAIAYLASPFLLIHPHEYYAKVGPKGMSARPIGTGPFRVVEFDPGKHLLLERNRDYFRDSPKSQPKLDKVEICFIPDAQTRIAGMAAGGLDLIMYVAPDQAEQMRAIPSLKIVSGETMRINYMKIATTPNAPAPPLRDLKVRQAIAHAIDREAIAKYLVGEGSRVVHAECYPRQFGCIDETVPRYDYNPQKARQLLAEAGYANGFAVDLYAYRDRNQVEAIVGYLNAVGIKARLRFMQFAAIMAAQRNGKTPLSIDSNASAGIMDAGYLTSRNHELSADDVNKDTEVRDLLIKADSTMDLEARKAAYAEAFKLIADRVYSLPLYSIPNYYLARKDLMMNAYEDDHPRFWEMYYE